MVVFVDQSRGCWMIFSGTLEQCRKKYGAKTISREINAHFLGPLSQLALQRPFNYFDLPSQEQWDIDKNLGILDWDGDPLK